MSEVGGVQIGVDAFVGVVMAIGAGLVRLLRTDQKELKKAHDHLVDSLPNTYARRDDVKDGFRDLHEQQQKMNDKLDRLLVRP